MKTEHQADLVRKFFDNTAQTYDKIVNITTFGRDKYWKKEIIKKIPECNSILDLGCGTGILTFQITEKFPEAKIVGVDTTKRYLDVARKKLKPIHKIIFLLHDAEKLGLASKFDCITASYTPKYCSPDTLVKVCVRHLNPGGKIILHDFTYPQNKIMCTLWNLYFVILRIVGNFIPDWKNVFEDLPKQIRSTTWLDDYKDIMKRNNFEVKVQSLTLGSSAILAGIKKV
ncbi:MAG: class I SAM-dependent methyltransferase [Thaumarchaeota archaeon]|nr:class I SAM-dependent methyltransferase [Nitrososphaerota archaeon]MBI3641564.1 class I SAM-dependent methyltransferase [Nitrososphaerota archaeon]